MIESLTTRPASPADDRAARRRPFPRPYYLPIYRRSISGHTNIIRCDLTATDFRRKL